MSTSIGNPINNIGEVISLLKFISGYKLNQVPTTRVVIDTQVRIFPAHPHLSHQNLNTNRAAGITKNNPLIVNWRDKITDNKRTIKVFQIKTCPVFFQIVIQRITK